MFDPHTWEKFRDATDEAKKAQAELDKMKDALAEARGPSTESPPSVLRFVEDADVNRSMGLGVKQPDKTDAQDAKPGTNTEAKKDLPGKADAKKSEVPPGGPVSMVMPSAGGPMALASFVSAPAPFGVPDVEKTPTAGTPVPIPYPADALTGPSEARLGFARGVFGPQLNSAVVGKAMLDRSTQLGAGFWEADPVVGRRDIEPPSLAGTLLSVLRAVMAGTPVQAATKPAVYFSNTGRSTGPGAIEMTYVGDAPPPDNVGRMVVLEPVSASDAAKIDRERRETPRARTFTKTLTMYCLNHDLKVPGAGQFMKLADAATHRKFTHILGIRDAAARLKSGGQLHPDTDRESYFHAAVQWAIWTVEKRFTDRSYAEAFVQQTRKNVEATGTAWSAETEGLVRQLAPGRWRDIHAVLTSARLVH